MHPSVRSQTWHLGQRVGDILLGSIQISLERHDNQLETVERCCDPVECIRDLIGNPAFKDIMVYEPVRVKREGQRYYSEMNTGDWWWNIQVRTIQPDNATSPSQTLA